MSAEVDSNIVTLTIEALTLLVNNSPGPLTVAINATLAFKVSGAAAAQSVQIGFNTTPTWVSNIFVASQGAADANGNFNGTYTLIPGTALTFYIAAMDGTGKLSNWVTVTD